MQWRNSPQVSYDTWVFVFRDNKEYLRETRNCWWFGCDPHQSSWFRDSVSGPGSWRQRYRMTSRRASTDKTHTIKTNQHTSYTPYFICEYRILKIAPSYRLPKPASTKNMCDSINLCAFRLKNCPKPALFLSTLTSVLSNSPPPSFPLQTALYTHLEMFNECCCWLGRRIGLIW
jgi:hypothetical protein